MLYTLRQKLLTFMSARNGVDRLCFALLILYLILGAVNLFFRTPVLQILMLLVLVYLVFRIFSKNVYRRSLECEKFDYIWKIVKNACKTPYLRLRDIKTHRYRKCPACKATLRLPKKKGKHTAVCPKCKNEFPVNIHF
ncbi:MAG TPA: hypothetical protein IAD34_01015 [Candidatus Scatovicinus merdipullorum]|nr:hypothetical protein [Candidatus Scatovicinus merdipullorum]